MSEGVMYVASIPHRYGRAVTLVVKNGTLYVTTTLNFVLSVNVETRRIEEMASPH